MDSRPPCRSPAFPAGASGWILCVAISSRSAGAVDVKSSPGGGTSFVIKIPLTLAIVAALIVDIGDERFAFPQLSVLELVRLGGEHRIERIKSAPVLRLRQKLLPLVDVRTALQLETSDTVNGFVVVAQAGG